VDSNKQRVAERAPTDNDMFVGVSAQREGRRD
jgi:hypothetical protein